MLLLLLWVPVSPSFAADPGDQPHEPVLQRHEEHAVALNKEYFADCWRDTKNIVTSPGRWDSSDWITASTIMGVSLGLYTQDDKIKTWVQKNKNSFTSHTADDAATIYRYSIPALAGLGVYGYLAADNKAKSTFLLGAESAIITAVFVQTLKRSTGRHRPYTGDSHDTWSGPTLFGHNDRLSFPSGDASTAFAMASVVASEYDNRVVPPLVYTASVLVAFERVHNNVHWSTDVFLGSAIGYFTGKSVVRYHRGKTSSNFSIAPMVDSRDKGIMVTYWY
jgi:membrane-associated phospholipid phosphatase